MMSVISLIALALGYRVFAEASREKEGLKILGQIIGIVVMVSAVLALLCGFGRCVSSAAGKTGGFTYGCPIVQKGS